MVLKVIFAIGQWGHMWRGGVAKSSARAQKSAGREGLHAWIMQIATVRKGEHNATGTRKAEGTMTTPVHEPRGKKVERGSQKGGCFFFKTGWLWWGVGKPRPQRHEKGSRDGMGPQS